MTTVSPRTYRPISRTMAIPLKNWVGRAGLLLLVAASVALIALSNKDNNSISRLRSALLDGLVPVVDMLSRPALALRDFNAWIDKTRDLYAENKRLRGENAALLQWQTSARQFEVENESLRALLRLKAPRAASFVTARVVGGAKAVYTHRLLLDSGSAHGLAADQAVATDQGLVGRVRDLGARSAGVLLLTDINSRVPVIGETSREKALLTGDNSKLPRLDYTRDDSRLRLGERIVTTDDGGVLPGGLAVGEITDMRDGVIRVTPYADPASLEYVRIVAPRE